MYIVNNRIEAPVSDQFEQHFAGAMRSTLQGVPGLIRSTLMRPTQPGQPYVSTMEFDSEESFRAWMSSDSFQAAHANTEAPGAQAKSAIEAYTVVEDIRP